MSHARRPRPESDESAAARVRTAFCDTGAMHPYDPLPFHGTVVWLTAEHGGRRTGPPVLPAGRDYAANGFVPPLTAQTGLASLVIRAGTADAWRSAADAGWLVREYQYPREVQVGDTIIVTEGSTVVGYFHVESVD